MDNLLKAKEILMTFEREKMGNPTVTQLSHWSIIANDGRAGPG